MIPVLPRVPVRFRHLFRLAPIALAALLIAALVALPGRGETQGAFAPSPGWPVSGLPAQDVIPLGASPESAPGEVWGIGSIQGHALADGSPSVPAAGLLRQRQDGGWQFVSRVIDRTGKPVAAWPPVRGAGAGRVTPRGGIVYATGEGRLFARAPTEQLREMESPDAALLPGDLRVADPSRVTLAAYDEAAKTHVLVAPVGAVEDRVLHHDGAGWTAETIDVPAGATDFKVAAIAVDPSGGDAWLTASAGDGVLLYRRDATGGGAPTWEEVDLTGAKAFVTTSDTRPLAFPAEGLTAVAGGLWIDAEATFGADGRSVVMRFDTTSRRVVRTWCEEPACDAKLGIRLAAPPAPDAQGRVDSSTATSRGYRSFAFGGSGLGERVITNPVLSAPATKPAGAGYAVFDGSVHRAVRAGGPRESRIVPDGAFTDARTGWLAQSRAAVTRISPAPVSQRLQAYPLPSSRALLAIAPEPGRSPADPAARAIAVGDDGRVLRYLPEQGWVSEQLASGAARATPRLNAVAWPEPTRAHAAGQDGELWLWRQETGIWERDENAPLDLVGDQYTGIAFQPGNPDRGYLISQARRVFSYGKSWTPESVPGLDRADELRSVAFAGGQALIAATSKLLVNDGSGWRVDEEVAKLMDEQASSRAELYAVAGLPDGGAIAAGKNIVLVRDAAGAPWRLGEHQLVGSQSAVTAIAAVRSGDKVRGVAITTSEVDPDPFAPVDAIPEDPGRPAVIYPARSPIAFGMVLRETDAGWADEERVSYHLGDQGSRAFEDCPYIPDPAHALALDASGEGWVVGGDMGQGSTGRCAPPGVAGQTTSANGDVFDSSAAWRYGASPPPPPAITRNQPALAAGPARLLVGGHAACRDACAEVTVPGIAPDRYLSSALDVAAQLYASAGGPRALLYTGTRVAPSVAGSGTELARYSGLLGTATGRVPVFVAPAKTDAGADAGAFSSSMAGLPAPQGGGAAPANVRTGGVIGGEPAGGARTHYAFDTTGPEGALRVVVIDNSSGSLATSDAHQVPAVGAGGQRAWLVETLRQARAQGIPAVVMGSRALSAVGADTNDGPATDGAEIAQLLVDEGASAYVFDSPEKNVRTRVPSGSPGAIPAFGSGSLGYADTSTDAGFALLEFDLTRRDAASNRVPVTARLVPVLEDISIDARDGREVRRSSPALFVGLGRRPRAGNPFNAQRAFSAIPNEDCRRNGCPTSIDLDATFTSSNPEVGDFVRTDPARLSNPRAVFLDDTSKPVRDNRSALFCAFNAGETTVSVTAGGLTYSTTVRVLSGTPRQPCGTVARTEQPVQSAAPAAPGASPPGVAPATDASPGGLVAPPPVAVAAPVPAVPAAPPVALSPPPPASILPTLPPLPALPPVLAPLATPIVPIPPPPVGSVARPSPPGGATVRVYEEKREEEEAYEQSSAAVRYQPGSNVYPSAVGAVTLLVVAAAAGSTITRRHRRRTRRTIARQEVY